MKKLPDSRYTVTREGCGYPGPRYVSRFCGDWIGSADTRAGAVALARTHRAAFLRPWRGAFAAAN
jgi:hypothetical protein